jgi:hypothetical protein
VNSFWERINSSCPSERARRRFIYGTKALLDACLQQVLNRDIEEMPSIEEFIRLRRNTSAVWQFTPLVEYCMGLDLPDKVMESDFMQKIGVYSNDIMTWSNVRRFASINLSSLNAVLLKL